MMKLTKLVCLMFSFSLLCASCGGDDSGGNDSPDVPDTPNSGISDSGIKDPVLKNLVRNMVHVQGGTFMMGAISEQGNDAEDNEKPAHQVTLSSFYIGRYEVTQEEWKTVMGKNPSKFEGDKRPVDYVSYRDCQKFIVTLNSLTGKKFRLPTEAEWEYAARGGNKSKGYKYAGSNELSSVAWFGGNSGNITRNVGTKNPNELGLYDMSGNVWEWCSDYYGKYSSAAQTNPKGSSSGFFRVLRGGSCYNVARDCRSSVRSSYDPDSPDYGSRYFNYGLRLVLSE